MVALSLPRLGLRRNSALALLVLVVVCAGLLLSREGEQGDASSPEADFEKCLGSQKPLVKMPRRGPVTYSVHSKTPLSAVADLRARGWKPQTNPDQPAVVLLTTYKDWKRMSAKYTDGAHFVNLLANAYHLALGPLGIAAKSAAAFQMGCELNTLPFMLPAYDLANGAACERFVQEQRAFSAGEGATATPAWRLVLNPEFWLWADSDDVVSPAAIEAAVAPAQGKAPAAHEEEADAEEDQAAERPAAKNAPRQVVPPGYALTHVGAVARASRLLELLDRPGGCDTLQRKRQAFPRIPENLFVQKCLSSPMLLGQRRFYIRSYLLIASTTPFMVFRRDGYVQRFVDPYEGGIVDACDHAFDGKRRVALGRPGAPSAAAAGDAASAPQTFTGMVDLAPDIAKYEAARKASGRGGDNMLTLDMAQFRQQCLDSGRFDADEFDALDDRRRHIERFVFESARSRLRRRHGSFQLVTVDIGIEGNGMPVLLSVDINPTMQVSLSVWVQQHSEALFRESLDLVLDANLRPWEYAKMGFGESKFHFEMMLNERMERCGQADDNPFSSYDMCVMGKRKPAVKAADDAEERTREQTDAEAGEGEPKGHAGADSPDVDKDVDDESAN